MRLNKARRRFLAVVAVLLALVFIFSAYQLISYYTASQKDDDAFDKLSEQVQKLEQTMDTDTSEGTEGSTETADPQKLPHISALYEQNSDTFGWIRIEDTKVDYPVMYTPDNEQYYLRKNFEKKYSQSGVPFLAAGSFENCGNYLIYGHNMKNGSMFASILNYEKKSYWEEHKIIKLDTMYEQAEYEVIAAFRARIVPDGQDGFRYYLYTNLTEESKFNEYIAQVEQHAIFETGIEAEYGDQLLTLSTCAYHTTDGRFVVVAKRIT